MRDFKPSLHIVLLFAAISFLQSCIIPPSTVSPSVVEASEIRYLQHMRAAQDAVALSKYDTAEIQLLRAIALFPNIGNAYNDLGFVMQETGRTAEALETYRRALELAINNLVIRDNYSRALYKQNRFEEAIVSYQELLNRHYLATFFPSDIKPLSALEFVSIYRNLALLYYSNGEIDEALCHSWLATNNLTDVLQTGEHIRLLLSMERDKEAIEIQKRVIEIHGIKLPSQILLDMAFANFQSRSYEAAWAFADLVLTSNDANSQARALAFCIHDLSTPYVNEYATEVTPAVPTDDNREGNEVQNDGSRHENINNSDDQLSSDNGWKLEQHAKWKKEACGVKGSFIPTYLSAPIRQQILDWFTSECAQRSGILRKLFFDKTFSLLTFPQESTSEQ